jgi:molybdopterin molybdotransferase
VERLAVLGVARDSQSDLLDRLGSDSRPDLYVTSGGVSVGDYDVVKDVLQAHGSIDVWQVHMKPGRPLAFGNIDNTPLLGLPGNPLAAFVSFLQFGRPLIRKMLGKSDLTLPQVEARLTRSLDNRGNRRQFALGVVAREEARLIACPAGSRGSGILSPSGQVNCLIVVPETLDRLEADAPVNVQIFDGVQV